MRFRETGIFLQHRGIGRRCFGPVGLFGEDLTHEEFARCILEARLKFGGQFVRSFLVALLFQKLTGIGELLQTL